MQLAAVAVVLAALARPSLSQTPGKVIVPKYTSVLSEADSAGYVNGQGMGLAKAAELNGYPGPKHVLELAEQLRLSESQAERTKQSFDSMHLDAVRLGKAIVEKEQRLGKMYAEKKITPENLAPLVMEIGALQSQLRLVHLKAHTDMVAILSEGQIKKYAELRGYLKPTQMQHQH